jgi:hypothetical protein
MKDQNIIIKIVKYIDSILKYTNNVNYAGYTDVAEPPFRRVLSHPSGIVEPLFR